MKNFQSNGGEAKFVVTGKINLAGKIFLALFLLFNKRKDFF